MTRLVQRLTDEVTGGVVLLIAAVLALGWANSPWVEAYHGLAGTVFGPAALHLDLTVAQWASDGLLAVFFFVVGVELKHELAAGSLRRPREAAVPVLAAVGGMLLPALIFVAVVILAGEPAAAHGWAIPTATDIAFALGILSLLGNRVPVSLKVFLTALAIIDDLGAVVIIAAFYTGGISLVWLGGAAAAVAVLIALNRAGVMRLWVYLLLGAVLWVLVLKSGIHATIAGVVLAMTIPLRARPGGTDDLHASPLHRLEHGLHGVVAFFIVPLFGFANAGVSFAGVSAATLIEPLTLGVAGGLLIGKLVGVYGFSALAIRAGIAERPAHATRAQMLGVALLCGVGFTMSLFISLLAFADSPLLQDEAKLGILGGSLAAGLLGYLVLRMQPRPAKA